MSKLSHLDEAGRIRMVDISEKPASARVAVASGRVILSQAAIEAIRARRGPKGDPLETARLAGIMAAKRTSDLIPLCHQINLAKVDVTAEITESCVLLTATASTTSQTGVEMEALTAVTIAALTIYDMCKAIQKDIEITEIRLESKTGGKADYLR